MYSKEQVKEFKVSFWTSFGLYMKKHQKRGEDKINWVNYKTKIKDLYFRLNATNKKVSFAIELQHKDEGIRELFFDQFLELKTVLEDNFNYPLTWEKNDLNDFNIPISSIKIEYGGVNIFDKNTWQEAFMFMEKNMLSIHEFWGDFKDVFKQLE